MLIEYVLMLVDIEDSSATRLARKKLSNDEKDFFFMLPKEYFEYNPQDFFIVLDESITESSDFDEGLRKRMIKSKKRGGFKEYSMENLAKIFKHQTKVLIFCKGVKVRTEILLELKDFCEENPHVIQLPTQKCDPEYDRFEDLFCFDSFLEEILVPVKAKKGYFF